MKICMLSAWDGPTRPRRGGEVEGGALPRIVHIVMAIFCRDRSDCSCFGVDRSSRASASLASLTLSRAGICLARVARSLTRRQVNMGRLYTQPDPYLYLTRDSGLQKRWAL